MRSLDYFWNENDIGWSCEAERTQLRHETIHAIACYLWGSFECAMCLHHGRHTVDKVEGHHVKAVNMYISDYKHNKKRKNRRKRIRELLLEMATSVVLLCKTCHELVHHCRYP